MNEKDKKILFDEWVSNTNEAEDVIQDCVKRAQDHAYQLGFERGKLNTNKALIAIEQMIAAIDVMWRGDGTKLEQINGVEEAYRALEELHKELTC